MASIGESGYRRGALERLEEAGILLRHELFGGSAYLAGRAVEGMLRAMIWRGDPDYRTGKKSLDTGHDLRTLLRLVRNLGVFPDSNDDLVDSVQHIAQLWFNNMRLLDTKEVAKHWRAVGALNPGRPMKKAAWDYYDVCCTIVNRCEALCQR